MMKTEQAFAAKPRFEILDGLRGVAALLVVAFHLFETYSGGDHTRQILNHGYLAVDFFFILSGFVIGYAYDDRWAKGMTTGTFFKRRLVRLHPLVILGTAFGALTFYFQGANPDWAAINATPWWKLVSVTLFCFTLLPLPPRFDIRGWSETNPLNGPAWSLQWEYLANILYATAIRRFSKVLLAAFVAASGALTVLLAFDVDVFGVLAAREYAAFTVIGGWSTTPDQLLVGATRLLYPFFGGLLLSRLGAAIRVRRFGFELCTLLVVAALAMPYFAPAGSPWVNGLYEAAVILAVFPLIVALGAGSDLREGRIAKLCRFSGEISYPAYILHFPLVCVQASWAVSHADASRGQHVFVSVSCFLLAVALAWASLKLYDLPVRNWLSGRREK